MRSTQKTHQRSEIQVWIKNIYHKAYLPLSRKKYSHKRNNIQRTKIKLASPDWHKVIKSFKCGQITCSKAGGVMGAPGRQGAVSTRGFYRTLKGQPSTPRGTHQPSHRCLLFTHPACSLAHPTAHRGPKQNLQVHSEDGLRSCGGVGSFPTWAFSQM